MRLRPNDTSGRTEAETEADERAVDDGAVDDTAVDDADAPERSTVVPTFTPAARNAPDDVADDDVTEGTVVEGTAGEPDQPARGYPADDVAGEQADVTARDSAYQDDAAYQDNGTYRDDEAAAAAEPAAGYAEPEPAETATAYEAPADTAEPATAAPLGATTADPANAAADIGAVPVPAVDLDQPLLSGNTELLNQWQQVQAQFVDDPQVAVAGAADLVQQASRALAEALEQRQRQMRTMWDNGSADGSAAPGDAADTEQLRQLMHRYRALFNQLYQPV
jgi:hypothetical protein